MLQLNTVSGKVEELTGDWNCYNSVLNVFGQQADAEADARAKMLIYLIENHLLPLSCHLQRPS